MGLDERSERSRLIAGDALHGIGRPCLGAFVVFADAAVKEVASRVGYANESAFARAFMRDHGVSPARYRERITTRERMFPDSVIHLDRLKIHRKMRPGA